MKTNKLSLGILFLVACGSEVTPKHQTPSSAPTATALTAKNDAGVAVAAKADTTPATAPVATTEVLRHLPGTAIMLAGNSTVYMVTDVGTLSAFLNATALHTSGYSDAMVITITAAEFSCYGVGKTIKSGLPAPAAGHVRDGTLVKENGKSTVYAVSDGVAWSIFNQNVYTSSGYKDATVEMVSAGTLSKLVDEVGNCSLGVACLDTDYISSCAKDDLGGIVVDPGSGDDTDTSVGTSVATSVTTSAGTAVATGTPVQTQSTANTQTAAGTQTTAGTQTNSQTVPATGVATSVATSTPTSVTTSVATAVTTTTPTAVATNTETTSVATATGTAVTVSAVSSGTNTATQTVTQPTATATAAPGTWVWVGDGAKICLNAVYFMPQSATRAVLRTWSGPYITGTNGGPVTGKDGQGRFCWDFTGMQAGVYTFWADVPAASCATADFCGDDGITGDGAQYGLATNATTAEKKWLECVPTTGCDGYAAFNGKAWIAGNP